jgi:hypothetical protein
MSLKSCRGRRLSAFFFVSLSCSAFSASCFLFFSKIMTVNDNRSDTAEIETGITGCLPKELSGSVFA